MTYAQIRQILGDDTMADMAVDQVMYRARIIAQGLCEHPFYVAGPHEGCAEFTGGEEHYCAAPAEYVVLYLKFDEHLGVEVPTTSQLCEEHAFEGKPQPGEQLDQYTKFIGADRIKKD